MRFAVRPWALALLVPALAACGSGGSTPSPPPTTAATTEQPTPPLIVRLLEPTSEAVLHGRRYGHARQQVTVPVHGQASGRAVLRLQGACEERSCARNVLSTANGDFAGSVTLVLPRTARSAALTVDYAVTPAARTQAQIDLRIRPPRRATTAERRAGRGEPRRRARQDPTPSLPPAAPESEAPLTVPTIPAPATPTDVPPATVGGNGQLVLVGDSLAVGIQDLLPAAMPGWAVVVNGRVGRPLAEGMNIVENMALPKGAVLALSLFTNDPPGATGRLQAAIRQSLAKVGSGGCVVWATLVGRRKGKDVTDYTAANDLLRAAAAADRRIQIADWAALVAAQPDLVPATDVHPSEAGYRLRAQLFAQAAARCP